MQTNFRLELALTPQQIQAGMMGRAQLDRDAGMLFVFTSEQPRRFWMKGCLIPLDVLFLDKGGRIVAVHTMSVPRPEERDDPPSYPSTWPAQFAIELNSGRAAELGLKAGGVVRLPFEKLKRWADQGAR